MLRGAPRVELKRMMRAKGDQVFIKFLKEMRCTDTMQPVSDAFLQHLRKVTMEDIVTDISWRFAPIGVLSHVERDTINHAQLKAFASQFKLPVIRWKLPLVDGEALNAEVLNQLYENEPNLWGYFVEGAPVHITANINSVRKLVNGTPGLLHSLILEPEAHEDQAKLAEGYRTNTMVTLAKPPRAVNIIVGGTPSKPIYWHEVPLEDLSGLIPNDYYDGQQVIPLFTEGNDSEEDLNSLYAAHKGIAHRVSVKGHGYAIAFAMTDFKLQGRTLPKLIISICDRPRPPYMTLPAFYVLSSRVQSMQGLRLLQFDKKGLSNVSRLRPSETLHGWEHGYSRTTSTWKDSLAAAAMQERRASMKTRTQAAATARNEDAATRRQEAQTNQRQPIATNRHEEHEEAMQRESAQKKPIRRAPTCTACGAKGHTARNKNCPKKQRTDE